MSSKSPESRRIAALEREVARLKTLVAAVGRRERVYRRALGLGPRARAGDSGRLGDLEKSVLHLQEYLLRTSERIDKILTALKEHREFLAALDKRFFQTGTRERIRMELDIMKNTLSILAIAGVEVDDGIVKDIDKVRASALKDATEPATLAKEKEALDKRYEEELKRFDLEAIWAKKREIPGYR